MIHTVGYCRLCIGYFIIFCSTSTIWLLDDMHFDTPKIDLRSYLTSKTHLKRVHELSMKEIQLFDKIVTNHDVNNTCRAKKFQTFHNKYEYTRVHKRGVDLNFVVLCIRMLHKL